MPASTRMAKRNSRSLPLLPQRPSPASAPSSPDNSFEEVGLGSPRSSSSSSSSFQHLMSLFKKHDDESQLLLDTEDDGTVLTHPLIKDVKHTFAVRIWRDWKGGVVGALLSFTIGLCLPESVMMALYPLRFEVARLIATSSCCVIMFFANYVEHVVQPPVEPKGITSFSGKSVFFTVTVIGVLLIYYSVALVTQLLNLFNSPSQLLNYLTYHYFVPSYALGTMLSVFYYAGVLGDPDEKKNIERWHRRGVPLARYLHSTHSTSIFCVNVDLIFKNAEMLQEHVPSMDSVVVTLYTYGVCYATWVLINYSQTGYFPYPFMNGMGNWQYPAFFLAIMANVAVIMGVLSCLWIAQVKGCEMMSVTDMVIVLVLRAKDLL